MISLRMPSDSAVIVAMRTVLVMQMSGYDVINVSRVRNGLVPALCTVHVRLRMLGAVVTLRAIRGMLGACGKFVFVNVSFVCVMQMTIVGVISVVTVLYGGVATSLPVNVLVLVVNSVRHATILPHYTQKRTRIASVLQNGGSPCAR